ncbi:MAG TPA: hypothetical protein VFD92_23925 [Candidatus Binatia bacterium]|nr:hypothetical protein [Candidatus Binatia bacterium]
MALQRVRALAFAAGLALASLGAAACGGSGSTGLISPEGAVLEEVRRDGTCVRSGATLYCATDSGNATTPGGMHADVGDVAPAPGCPEPGDGSCGLGGTVTFAVSGFGEGAACASAARPAGEGGAWQVGAPVDVGGVASPLAFPLADALAPGELEIALLCFAAPPDELPTELRLLADAAPDVVFVPRSDSTLPTAPRS